MRFPLLSSAASCVNENCRPPMLVGRQWFCVSLCFSSDGKRYLLLLNAPVGSPAARVIRNMYSATSTSLLKLCTDPSQNE